MSGNKPLKVFVGYDGRERVAYDVLRYSIERHKTSDVQIIPLYHKQLRRQGFFQRPWLTGAVDGNHTDLIDQKPFSTEFSHTRFLVPELCGFKGWALFMDCDMLVRSDISELFELRDKKYAVMCVKHRQEVKKGEKMDGTPQQGYYRKNWSSFMLFNCGHEANKKLTKEVVNTAPGGWLHALSWLEDHQIGSLPEDYNWIEGCSKAHVFPRVIHYTLGGPWFSSYDNVMYAEEWDKYYAWMMEDLPDPSDKILNVNYGALK